MTSKGFLDDLVARIRGFVHQLRDSLKTPGERRPSFHLAISTAARYIICGAAVSKTWQSWPTPGAGPVEFRLLRDTLTELAAELAQIAFIGAALFYYENCGLQVSPSALPPQDCLPREAVELIAAWAASLRQYRIPTEDVRSILLRLRCPVDVIADFLYSDGYKDMGPGTRSRRRLSRVLRPRKASYHLVQVIAGDSS